MTAVTGGVIAAVLSFIVGMGGLIVALRRDRVVEATGIATGQSSELNLALAGMTGLVENLQADNRSLREEAGRLRGEIDRLSNRLNGVVAECDELARQLKVIRRKYGDNGDNGS